MHIKQRRLLVVMLIAGQLGCMAFGVAWATGWLHTSFDRLIRHRVEAEGRSMAGELAMRVAALAPNGIESGSQSQENVQRLCEQTATPHDGHIVVFRRDDGTLLCHTHLGQQPELLNKLPGRALLEAPDSALPLAKAVDRAVAQGQSVAHGRLEVDGKLYVATACAVPNSKIVLAVHQLESSVDRNVAQLVQPVFQVGYALTAFILGATSILTVLLVNRYETSLAEINANLEQEVQRRTDSLVRTRNAVVFGLAKLAESRDGGTGRHLERISSYVKILATELSAHHAEINEQYIADIAVASSLHDIGKVGVPDAILLKPGALTPDERMQMERHTRLGSACLAAIRNHLADDDFLELAQEISLAHHEQWDGSGYPQGLQRDEIPLAARIVALADVYDALTTERPYKKAMPHHEAKDWIASRIATQFDPDVVEAFLAKEREFFRVNQFHIASDENSTIALLENAESRILRGPIAATS